MNASWKEEAFASALRSLGEGAPRDLVARAMPDALDRGQQLTAADLTTVIKDAAASSAFLSALGMMVHKWDAVSGEDWVDDTAPSTPERRKLVCQKLGLDTNGAQALLEQRPIFHDETIVITKPWDRWYTAERRTGHAFYWPRYSEYLAQKKGWDAANIVALDNATTDVLERLSDPLRAEAYQAKGLVVGYVQSGKTANITGVVAKAIDAGYRLVIVMTGTIELLRTQTQRRIDMEMVGRQNIRGEASSDDGHHHYDYEDDDDWREGRFLDLGTAPIPVEIQRLTQHRADYTNLGSQFMTLRMERLSATKPLYHPDNVFSARARLAVVKKNAAVLRKLVRNIKANKTAFAEIPVLIIDDESDEASINVMDPEKVRRAEAAGKQLPARTAINEQIAAMLELMPRTQYVGYTATPFANVFADPDDDLGTFPRDFLIGLPKPPGYMGLEEFLDLPESDDTRERRGGVTNEEAHVRRLEATDGDADLQATELRAAIDAFVLTGAMKLHRRDLGAGSFRHHTMLVHQDVRKDAHRELADRIKGQIWPHAGYATPAGLHRLEQLYRTDIRPIADARREPEVPAPPTFEELRPYIGAAVARISEHSNNPVIVVNSDREIEQEKLDFDQGSTWRILVGGAKLSRGFTVEGLTITYFRRATDINATLMQMGRWFGFRQGFSDLVRLYIARHATFGKRELDLYDAFVGVALDEAAFRDQLRLYAGWDGDKPRLVPSQIPPLVSQHLPWLRPVAKNKMFNAVLVEQEDQPFTPTGYSKDPFDLWTDLDAWRPHFAKSADQVEIGISGRGAAFQAMVGVVSATDFVRLVGDMHFIDGYAEGTINPKLEHYRQRVADGSLKDMLLVLPQVATDTRSLVGVGPRKVVVRERRADRGGLFGEVTDPKHRPAMEAFVDRTTLAPGGLEPFRAAGRGALLMYVVHEKKPPYHPSPPHNWQHPEKEYGLVVTFSSYLPAEVAARHRGFVRFSVRKPAPVDDATVDVD